MGISGMVSHGLQEFTLLLIDAAGNLHLNVIAEVYSKEIEEALEPFVYELVGTPSAFPP